MYTVKARKRGVFLPAMKGSKANESKNMHVHGVKEAKPSFRMVINHSESKGNEKKKLRKIHLKMLVHGVKPAKSSFGRVRNPSRVEREWKKTSKLHPTNFPI